MTDRPIIFSVPMIRALLDGRKTQTRRVLKQQPVAREVRPLGFFGVTNTFAFTLCDDGGANSTMAVPVPYAPGDRLWVREHWKSDRCYDDLAPSEMGGDEPLFFMADSTVERWGWKPDAMSRWGRFRQGRHIPRWASRLTLTVTDVRVQRVQEITDSDSECEGLYWDCSGDFSVSPREAFAELWDSLNAKRGAGWGANPWVCAISFDVHQCNIDQMEASQ